MVAAQRRQRRPAVPFTVSWAKKERAARATELNAAEQRVVAAERERDGARGRVADLEARMAALQTAVASKQGHATEEAEVMEEIFAVDESNCLELTIGEWEARDLHRKFTEFVLAPLRPLL